MSDDLQQLKLTVNRLQRHACRVREKILLCNRDDSLNALADVAETGEISRRCYPHPAAHLHLRAQRGTRWTKKRSLMFKIRLFLFLFYLAKMYSPILNAWETQS
jgi:hypothetical protein